MDAEGSGAGDAQQPLVSPARAGRSQSFATAATGAVAFILGSLLYVALVATEGVFGDPWLVFRAVVLSPQLIAWVVIVVLVGLIRPRAASATVVLCALVAAPLAAVIDALVRVGGSGFFVISVAWSAAGMLGAAIVGAVFGSLHRRGALSSRRRIALLVSLALLIIGGCAAFALPAQYLEVYFTIGVERPVATAAEAARYLLTATIAVAALVLSLITAIVARSRVLIVLTVVALLLAVAAALVLRVPHS